jgi:uncharacterized protein (TIGR03435 family)
VLILVVAALLAQSFDAASIKPRPPGPGTMMRETKGRIDYVGIPLLSVIARAYSVNFPQVIAPDWVYSDGYEIRATFPPNTPPEQVAVMLQTMLADRFHFAMHHEQRELSAYVLTVGKKGLKMKANPDGRLTFNDPTDAAGRHIVGTVTMPLLAQILSSFVGGPVVDQTGVEGLYDIGLVYSPRPDAAGDAPSIYTALQDQLGLKLESKKAPFDVIVVDRIDKVPSDN